MARPGRVGVTVEDEGEQEVKLLGHWLLSTQDCAREGERDNKRARATRRSKREGFMEVLCLLMW